MKCIALGLVLAMLVVSASALLPSRLIPHDHLLVGNVTAEQLRAHLAAEAQQLQNPSAVTGPADPSGSPAAISPAGGRIISVPPGLGLVLNLHFDLALEAAFLLLIPFLVYFLSELGVSVRAIALGSPDPPPRPARIAS